MKFHHVGIATKSISETLEFIKKNFNVAQVSNTVFDPNQNADLCMVTMEDGYQLELISGEAVKTFIKKHQYLYHICYSVNNIEEKVEELSRNNFVLQKPTDAILFGGKKVAFIISKIGLIELVES